MPLQLAPLAKGSETVAASAPGGRGPKLNKVPDDPQYNVTVTPEKINRMSSFGILKDPYKLSYSVIFLYAVSCLLWLFHVLSQHNPCPPFKGGSAAPGR